MTASPSSKYDSFEHSALHFLCNAGWGNESDGNAPEYGSYFTRISLGWQDVKPTNTEFTSLLEQWPDVDGIPVPLDEFRIRLTGHWLVAEDSNGFVHVRRFGTEAALIERFEDFAQHYSAWSVDAEGQL